MKILTAIIRIIKLSNMIAVNYNNQPTLGCNTSRNLNNKNISKNNLRKNILWFNLASNVVRKVFQVSNNYFSKSSRYHKMFNRQLRWHSLPYLILLTI